MRSGTMARANCKGAVLLSALLLSCQLLLRAAADPDERQRYNTKAGPVPGKLNVHLVAHTHDDVGWLKTVDQYYIGSNNSIQVAAVQYVLNSVVEKLKEDRNRKFIFVEQAFFQRWWREQGKHMKKTVQKLIKRGQLEFINGGWCMHDEATTHYTDLIDQTALGHRYINEQFGAHAAPRIGWQLDPFGHSAVQAYMLTAEMGFDAIFFSRGDWQDFAQRKKDRSLEFIWRASASLGESAQTFGGFMHHHYDPPEGFRWDIANPDPPLQDDPLLYDVNVRQQINLFVELCKEQAADTRGEHIMWAMGEDFAYSNAQTWFKNMDKLIHYANLDGRVNAFYSTPSMYLDSKQAENQSWPLKEHDFFPYANDAHNFWTGYFTSRPAIKGYVRSLNGLLMASRQLEAMVGRSRLTTDELEEAMAIAQHHDAVAGTEKQHVNNDYMKRLHVGDVEASKVFGAALSTLITAPAKSAKGLLRVASKDECGEYGNYYCPQELSARENIMTVHGRGSAALAFQRCPLLNVSSCPAAEEATASGKTLVVVAYNPLGWSRKEIVRLPNLTSWQLATSFFQYTTNCCVEVKVSSPYLTVSDFKGNPIPSQVIPVSHLSSTQRAFQVKAAGARQPLLQNAGIDIEEPPLRELVFEAEVPSMGFATFFVEAVKNANEGAAAVSVRELVTVDYSSEPQEEHLTSPGGSSGLHLRFSAETGRLTHMADLESGVSAPVDQQFLYYRGSDGMAAGPQSSGAYIFRPNSSDPLQMWPDHGKVDLQVVKGLLVTEVHQKWLPWASQTVRLYKNVPHAEFQFTVGPIPIDDDWGKEVVTRLCSNISSGSTFYTDSNGRDFLKRVLDYREDWKINVTDPVAGNYYPVNSAIFVQDKEAAFSVLVDRSVGGSSLRPGEIELMLHRRLLYDDNKGVTEALNETVCAGEPGACEGLTVTGKYYVNVQPKAEAVRWRRSFAQRILSPLQLAFAQEEGHATNWRSSYQGTFSALNFDLPPNVALITLQELNAKTFLVRLAHLYEANEDAEYSQMAEVNLRKLFPNTYYHRVTKIVELTLSGNRRKENVRPLKWTINGQEGKQASVPLRGGPVNTSYILELGPMEIRTLSVEVDYDDSDYKRESLNESMH